MKKPLLIGLIILIFISAGAIFFVTGGYGEKMMGEMKARGYIKYTTAEAIEMAIDKCTQCHSLDQIKKYCDRCGPPFIVVVHSMKKYAIPQWKQKYPEVKISEITDTQAVAIVQVWNGTVGNWEHGWRKSDLEKLLEGDEPLIALLKTSSENREIERAISKEVMSPAEKYQKETLGIK